MIRFGLLLASQWEVKNTDLRKYSNCTRNDCIYYFLACLIFLLLKLNHLRL